MGEDSDRQTDADPGRSDADESPSQRSLDDEPSDSDGSGRVDESPPDEADESPPGGTDESAVDADPTDEETDAASSSGPSETDSNDAAEPTESAESADGQSSSPESAGTSDGADDRPVQSEADEGEADEGEADESEVEESEEDEGEDAEDGEDEAGEDDEGEDGEDEAGEDDEGEDGEDEDEDDDAVGELTEAEYEEQLAEAEETNPPLDRDEVVDEEPIEASNGGAATADSSALVDNEMFDGPESDEEMPLAVHIEEMMRRLGIVFLFAGIATLIAFPTAEEMINYFWASHIPAPWENRPRLYGPLEFLLSKLKVSGLAGLVVGLPVFVYETYRFMRPGLYAHERRYYLAAVPTSLVLGVVGGAFAHFLVLPAIFSYFTTYTEGAAVIAFGLSETFNLIVMMIAMMALIFQIPLFIQLAIMMNITSRQWLEDKRLLFWGSFFGIAFIFSPDPTGMAPIIVTITMIVLFEGTLALLRWTGN